MSDDAIRTVPHNIEAEQALLGALLIDNRTFESVAEIVDETAFYEPLHGDIFRAIASRLRRGQGATPITLKEHFKDHAPLTDEISVWAYLVRLGRQATTTRNARDYARLVRDLARRRALILVGEDLAAAAYAASADESSAALIEAAEQRLYALAEVSTAKAELSFADALSQAFDDVHAAYQAGGVFPGAKTGYADLDAKLGGFGDTDLVILAGRPAIGKTALSINIALNVATSERTLPNGEVCRQGVHIFSQEMSAAQLAMRVLSDRASISSEKLRRGDVAESQIRRLMDEVEAAAPLPIVIDETGGLSVAQITSKARRVKRRLGTRLIVIDYLQLMRASGGRENRVQEMTEITTGLKALAKELGCPILALSQLSRKVEDRADKRPHLADLRESGSIEQDADTVLFVYRDDYYLAREEPDVDDVVKYSEWQAKTSRSAGKAEVIIAKNRHGGTGIVHLAFDAATTRFSNLAREGRHA